jgi:PST family polysaccharide transporter
MASLKKNIGYSALAQLLRYGAPLAFFPYLTRALGKEAFSSFALAYALAIVLGQLIEFGFGLSGVRSLAEAKQRPAEARQVVTDVIIGRAVLLLAVLVAFAITRPFYPDLLSDGWKGISAILVLTVSLGFVPSWYFIGRNRAFQYALMEAGATTVQLIAIILMIKPGSSFELAILLIAIPWLVVCLLGNVTAILDLGFAYPTLGRVRASLTISFRFFCFASLPQILARGNIFFLGFLSTPSQVAYYAVGERLLYAAVNMMTPVTRVMLPRAVSLHEAGPAEGRRFAIKTIYLLSAFFTVSAIVGAISSPWLVPFLFGPEIAPGVPAIAILLLTVPFMIVSRLIGMMTLVPMHREKLYQTIMLLAGFTGLAVAPISVMVGGALALALSRLFLETVTATGLLVAQSRVWRQAAISPS